MSSRPQLRQNTSGPPEGPKSSAYHRKIWDRCTTSPSRRTCRLSRQNARVATASWASRASASKGARARVGQPREAQFNAKWMRGSPIGRMNSFSRACKVTCRPPISNFVRPKTRIGMSFTDFSPGRSVIW